MLKKFTFFLVCFLLFILPVTAFSLGLGKITVYSNLNEPLNIQIELVNSKSTLLDDIIIKNARSSIYRRANLPRPEVFRRVKFKAKKAADGSIYVEVTSKRPVREPFITFIADLKWRTGHINREYTFLLDPPEFVQKQIRKKTLKTTRAPIQQPTDRSAKVTKTPRKAQHRKITYSSVAASSDTRTYATKRADTLWEIASKVKPTRQVSTYQTMYALFALNPDAFINNNIDLLKQGQTLRIPTVEEIQQIASRSHKKRSSPTKNRAATPAVIRQQSSTRENTNTPVKQQPAAQQAAQADNKTTAEEARLKIIPPAKALLNTPVTSKEDLLLINRALQDSITTIRSLKSENEVLSQQISELTAKLDNLDSHNLQLNDKISQITSQLNQRQTNEPAPAPAKTEPEQANIAEQTIADSETVTAGTVQPRVKVAADSKTASPAPVKEQRLEIDSEVASSVKQRSFVRELVTSPVIAFALAIFTIIVLFAVLYILRHQKEKRKNKKNNSYIPYPDKGNSSADKLTSADPTQKIQSDAVSDSLSSLQGTDISDEKDEEDMDFFEYFEKKINAPDVTPEKKAEPENSTEAEEISFDLEISTDEIEHYEENVLKPKATSNSFSEIDTYLAYGNYAEAEACLHTLLEASPTDRNLHLKLFECYTYANKRYQFIQHAEHNASLLNMDLVLRHRVENLFQQTWNESLDINNL